MMTFASVSSVSPGLWDDECPVKAGDRLVSVNGVDASTMSAVQVRAVQRSLRAPATVDSVKECRCECACRYTRRCFLRRRRC